jgi:UDP-N-acetyl-D-glucosamine dehydrogenase
VKLKENLIFKIKNKAVKIGVIGLGYVGLPLAVEACAKGYKVIGFDIQQKKVDMVNKGCSYISDVEASKLQSMVNEERLKATCEFQLIKELDVVIICVPTPLDKYQQPNISYIKNSAEVVGEYIKKGTLIILESTTYPGTTEELLLPILEDKTGYKCEEEFFLAFSPERVDPGNSIYKTNNIAKVVGGIGKDSTELAAILYRNILESNIYEVSSPKVAEMEKILENTYRNINIGLINEMAIICNKMNISIWEVIEAAKTKPYGFQVFYPGPGLGGHCIPLDPFYLTWKAREYGYHTRLIETSGEINSYMAQYIAERATKILNRFGKPVKDSNILILGIAYKKDIDDYRESPALRIIEILLAEGAIVNYFDPYIPVYNFNEIEHKGMELSKENLTKADLVIIITDHSKFDYSYIQENSKFIFDTRNATRELTCKDNIELL